MHSFLPNLTTIDAVMKLHHELFKKESEEMNSLSSEERGTNQSDWVSEAYLQPEKVNGLMHVRSFVSYVLRGCYYLKLCALIAQAMRILL